MSNQFVIAKMAARITRSFGIEWATFSADLQAFQQKIQWPFALTLIHSFPSGATQWWLRQAISLHIFCLRLQDGSKSKFVIFRTAEKRTPNNRMKIWRGKRTCSSKTSGCMATHRTPSSRTESEEKGHVREESDGWQPFQRRLET